MAIRTCLGGQVWSALDFSHSVWSVTAVWTEQGAASQEQGARGAQGPRHRPSHCLSNLLLTKTWLKARAGEGEVMKRGQVSQVHAPVILAEELACCGHQKEADLLFL